MMFKMEQKIPFQAKFIASIRKLADRPKREGWKDVVFAGRSNVGKSSLLNAICGRKKLAKTSKTPGLTQTLNFYEVEKYQLFFVDLPGYGYAKASKTAQREWRRAVDQYLTDETEITGVLLLIDAYVGPTPDDFEFIEWLVQRGMRFAILFTKSDKPNQSQFHKNLSEIQKLTLNIPILPVSVHKKQNVDKVIQLIQDWRQNG